MRGGQLDVSPQAYEHEHERMSKGESFLKYFVHVDKTLENFSLTHKKKSLLLWKNIFSCVHGWTIFIDKKMDELYFECCQQMLLLQKIEQKKRSK